MNQRTVQTWCYSSLTMVGLLLSSFSCSQLQSTDTSTQSEATSAAPTTLEQENSATPTTEPVDVTDETGNNKAQVTSPDPSPVLTLGGYDSNWGKVSLTLIDNQVSGTYDCCGGGTVEGTLTEGVIDYTWQQSDTGGKGRWTVVDDGQKLVGTWGYGNSPTDGGEWDLTR